MKLMVAMSETNDSVVEFDDNALPPPLLPSSKDYVCSFLCAAIEHMR